MQSNCEQDEVLSSVIEHKNLGQIVPGGMQNPITFDLLLNHLCQ